jgi:hypothetical protein
MEDMKRKRLGWSDWGMSLELVKKTFESQKVKQKWEITD